MTVDDQATAEGRLPGRQGWRGARRKRLGQETAEVGGGGVSRDTRCSLSPILRAAA